MFLERGGLVSLVDGRYARWIMFKSMSPLLKTDGFSISPQHRTTSTRFHFGIDARGF